MFTLRNGVTSVCKVDLQVVDVRHACELPRTMTYNVNENAFMAKVGLVIWRICSEGKWNG